MPYRELEVDATANNHLVLAERLCCRAVWYQIDECIYGYLSVFRFGGEEDAGIDYCRMIVFDKRICKVEPFEEGAS